MQENQKTLVAQGAMKPLLALLEGGSRRTAVRQTRQTACIAAWALCNLVKSAHGSAMQSLVSAPGFKKAVKDALQGKSSWDLVMEVAWLLSYIAAATQPLIQHILDADVMTPFLETLQVCAVSLPGTADVFKNHPLATAAANGHASADDDDASAMDAEPVNSRQASVSGELSASGRGYTTATVSSQPQRANSSHALSHVQQLVDRAMAAPHITGSEAGPSGRAHSTAELLQMPSSDEAEQVLMPLLRCVGNLASTATPVQVQALSRWNRGGALVALTACLKTSSSQLHKEAAWAVSNVASLQPCAEDLIRLGAVPIATSLLLSPALDVRSEAAYAVANLCVGGGDGSGNLKALQESVVSDEDAMRGFMQLLEAADWAVVYLALQFAEMVCRLLPDGEGAQLVERCGGLDRIEQLSTSDVAPAETTELAAHVLKRHFSLMD